MKRKRLSYVVVTVMTAILIAGCGGSHVIATAKNPQTKQDVQKAESIVQGCVSKTDWLSHKGREAVITCLAPPGHRAAFESCATKAITSGLPYATHHEREKAVQGLVVCVEEDR